MGTRFIASTECGASPAYKDLVVESTHDDVVYTDKVSGIHANFLRQTVPESFEAGREHAARRWRDIWSAGQGVSLIHDVQPIEQIVQQVVREFHDALSPLCR